MDGQTVTGLSPNCFQCCDKLTTIVLPDSPRSIGSGAFYSCDALETLHVPASVKSIGADAFGNCGQLLHIFYDGTQEEWDALYSQIITANTQIYSVDIPAPRDSFVP